jgi:hypothetical protein
MSTPPWRKFSVGRPSTRANWTEPGCQPLTSVAHVAHVPVALRIVEDGRLRADLVFDESKLNTERIRVVWLSPNDWGGAGGFRYGNVRFHFDWATLVEGKRSFWVESIAYGIPACRILLTDVDYTGTLDPYDPTAGDGPWWRSPSGEHYWNGNYCLEVMVEGDLDLGRATKVDFVDHHEKRCSIDYRTCPYCGTDKHDGGAEFIAAIVSRGPSLDVPGLVVDDGKGPKPSWPLEATTSVLLHRIAKASKAVTGTVARTDPGARALARAILATYANRGIGADLGELVAHFASVDDVEGAVADALAAAAGLPDASAFLVG